MTQESYSVREAQTTAINKDKKANSVEMFPAAGQPAMGYRLLAHLSLPSTEMLALLQISEAVASQIARLSPVRIQGPLIALFAERANLSLHNSLM
ncbi:hypothetical protein J6590_011491 [Homalodisca vitripennis]|nr:hypothetical protein J6590_011491 [Homalodisca vitripennis]